MFLGKIKMEMATALPENSQRPALLQFKNKRLCCIYICLNKPFRSERNVLAALSGTYCISLQIFGSTLSRKGLVNQPGLQTYTLHMHYRSSHLRASLYAKFRQSEVFHGVNECCTQLVQRVLRNQENPFVQVNQTIFISLVERKFDDHMYKANQAGRV